MREQQTGAAMRPIEESEIDRVADLLGRAFDDDPVVNYVAKQDARRAERVRHSMYIGLKNLTFPYGETYVLDGFEGAALWNPPGKRSQGFLADLKLLPDLFRIAGFRRIRFAMSLVNVLEKKHPKDPHYYLLAIGVEPSAQGRGFGSSLLGPMTERFDAERAGAYLENSKERNLPFYGRHGFEVVERVDLPHNGPPVWLMWRNPR